MLVLSQFAGAARELTEALIVNPYDVDGVAETLDRALQLSAVEQRVRIRENKAGSPPAVDSLHLSPASFELAPKTNQKS